MGSTGVTGTPLAKFWIALIVGCGVLAAVLTGLAAGIAFAPQRFARVMPARWAKRLKAPEPVETV